MVSVEEVSRSDGGFYALMGPLFGSREIAKEVGIHMYDDPDKRWFVAFEHDADWPLLGVASVRGSLVSDCYVYPDVRKLRVFTKILNAILEGTSGTLRANCTRMSRGAFLKAGFVEKSATKNFTLMELKRA